jgi:16S rRNA C967 or C1407 C5-methylase (RsmB/RsmF family)
MQDISITNMVLLCISFFGVGLAVIAIQSTRKLSLRLSKALELINSLHKLNETHQGKLQALEQSQSAENREHKEAFTKDFKSTFSKFEANTMQKLNSEIDSLKLEVDKLMAQIDEISQQDPAAKMYAKAHSLVASGASIEEIMDACDLPKAEVEVLIGFQKKARK